MDNDRNNDGGVDYAVAAGTGVILSSSVEGEHRITIISPDSSRVLLAGVEGLDEPAPIVAEAEESQPEDEVSPPSRWRREINLPNPKQFAYELLRGLGERVGEAWDSNIGNAIPKPIENPSLIRRGAHGLLGLVSEVSSRASMLPAIVLKDKEAPELTRRDLVSETWHGVGKAKAYRHSQANAMQNRFDKIFDSTAVYAAKLTMVVAIALSPLLPSAIQRNKEHKKSVAEYYAEREAMAEKRAAERAAASEPGIGMFYGEITDLEPDIYTLAGISKELKDKAEAKDKPELTHEELSTLAGRYAWRKDGIVPQSAIDKIISEREKTDAEIPRAIPVDENWGQKVEKAPKAEAFKKKDDELEVRPAIPLEEAWGGRVKREAEAEAKKDDAEKLPRIRFE